MKISKILSLLPLIVSMQAYALVDYSETSVNKEGPKEGSINKLAAKADGPRSESKSLIWKSDFSLNTHYEVQEVGAQQIGMAGFNTHLQTPFNFYFDMSYWQAYSGAGSQNGNPKGILGFNWFHVGNPNDEAKFDLYGGVKMAGHSTLASSRTDKIFGVETIKRFGPIGLGLGFDLTQTGVPQQVTDASLGNIQRIVLSGGIIVSNDIQFEFEVENFKINQASDTSRSNYLKQPVNFSTISPKLHLTIVPAMSVEMGARFRMNRANNTQDFLDAKLFDLHGAYSNSLFAGLNLNI